MRDIDGIDQALSILTPHWSQIESEFEAHNAKFLALSDNDHDETGRILKSHLIIESFIDVFISHYLEIEDISDLRLSFFQKAMLLPRAGSSASFVRPGILQLNKIRNKFGHRLGHVIEAHEIGAIYEVLSMDRSGHKFVTHIEAIEAFSAIACAFLSTPPKELRAVFAEAFAQIVSQTPNGE
jgi:hypothetical protein